MPLDKANLFEALDDLYKRCECSADRSLKKSPRGDGEREARTCTETPSVSLTTSFASSLEKRVRSQREGQQLECEKARSQRRTDRSAMMAWTTWLVMMTATSALMVLCIAVQMRELADTI